MKQVFEAGCCHYTKLTIFRLYVTLRGPSVAPPRLGVYVVPMWPSTVREGVGNAAGPKNSYMVRPEGRTPPARSVHWVLWRERFKPTVVSTVCDATP